MAKLDEEKELIGFLRAIFIVLVAIDSSLISWLFGHSQLTIKSAVVICAIIVVTIIDVLLVKYILKKIKGLEVL